MQLNVKKYKMLNVCVYFVTVILCVVFTTGFVLDSLDEPCTNQHGVCKEDNLACDGHYVSHLCGGHNTRRCCMPSTSSVDLSSGNCTAIGGQCQDDSNRCQGSYMSHLCSGSSTNRCCLQTIVDVPKPICDNIKVISRDTWGARRPTSKQTLGHQVNLFFIHHTAGHECHSLDSCGHALKGTQDYHMDTRHYNDIGYSFLVGEDGNIYEGRGWQVVGAHTHYYNDKAYAASFMGNFMEKLPPSASLDAVKNLIQCGVDKGYINPNYSLYGHRDVGTTACPGNQLYNEIRTWPHYNFSHSAHI